MFNKYDDINPKDYEYEFDAPNYFVGSCSCARVKYRVKKISLALWCFCTDCIDRVNETKRELIEYPNLLRTSSCLVTQGNFEVIEGVEFLTRDERDADSGNNNRAYKCSNKDCKIPYIFHTRALLTWPEDGKITNDFISKISLLRVKGILEWDLNNGKRIPILALFFASRTGLSLDEIKKDFYPDVPIIFSKNRDNDFLKKFVRPLLVNN